MTASAREKMLKAKQLLREASKLLSEAREDSPGDMLTRNAFLMSVKTYDLTVEAVQRNAPARPNQAEVESLYNSHDGE